MNNFELFSRPCMVAGLNFSPESNQQMISAAFSYDSSAKKVSFKLTDKRKNTSSTLRDTEKLSQEQT